MRVTADWRLKLGLVDIGMSVFVVGVIKAYGAAVAGVGCRAIIPALRKQKQEDGYRFRGVQGHIVRACLTKQKVIQQLA